MPLPLKNLIALRSTLSFHRKYISYSLFLPGVFLVIRFRSHIIDIYFFVCSCSVAVEELLATDKWSARVKPMDSLSPEPCLLAGTLTRVRSQVHRDPRSSHTLKDIITFGRKCARILQAITIIVNQMETIVDPTGDHLHAFRIGSTIRPEEV